MVNFAIGMPCDLNQIPGTQHEPRLLYYFTA